MIPHALLGDAQEIPVQVGGSLDASSGSSPFPAQKPGSDGIRPEGQSALSSVLCLGRVIILEMVPLSNKLPY